MTDAFKFFIGGCVIGLIVMIICSFIFDYFGKRKLERRNRLSLKRSETRKAMSCDNCRELFYYKKALDEVNRERLRLENAVEDYCRQINILQSSLTKARLHNEAVSEDKKADG